MTKVTKLHTTTNDRFGASVDSMMNLVNENPETPALILHGNPESVEEMVFAGTTDSVAVLTLMLERLKTHLLENGYNIAPE